MGNIDDQHINTNMNDKDHLVGQLTSAGDDHDDDKNPEFFLRVK